MPDILVVGAGNPLMGDDGAGIAVISALEQYPNLPFDVYDCGTDLLRLGILDTPYSYVVIIDAVRSGTEPGAVRWFFAQSPGQFSENESAHQLSVMESLQLLPLMNPVYRDTEFFIIGIEPGVVSTAHTLSEPVQRSVQSLVQLVLTPENLEKVISDYPNTRQEFDAVLPLVDPKLS